MSGPHLAFFHIGPETVYPTVLVRSLRANNAQARIIQCTDATGPAIEGVDEVLRFEGESWQLNRFRVRCFAQVPISAPTLFLDTDMICVRRLDPVAAMQNAEVAVCLREYSKDMILAVDAMGADLPEYAGRTIGEIYPYVACAVATDSPRFWNECLNNMQTLAPKFWRWFGDQEAIRNVIDRGEFKVSFLPESIYACLLDIETDPTVNPRICHFKGPGRKALMLDCARQAGFLGPGEAISAGPQAATAAQPVASARSMDR